jgi:hypothetical protein
MLPQLDRVAIDHLRDGIVASCFHADRFKLNARDGKSLPAIEARRIRHESLNHKDTTRCQSGLNVLEAPHLVVLRQDSEEGIEHGEDHGVGTVDWDICEIAD